MAQPQVTRVGVLALQGSFREHMTLLRRIPGVEPVEVRTKEELQSVAGLIIPGEPLRRAPSWRSDPLRPPPPPLPLSARCLPSAASLSALPPPTPRHLIPVAVAGGESTTMALVAERWGLIPELRAFAAEQRPIWGTCAGLIFLANRASGEASNNSTLSPAEPWLWLCASCGWQAGCASVLRRAARSLCVTSPPSPSRRPLPCTQA